eukprot:scaffold1058_cov362-Prasinococcus_capsulatus_cf.AAC.7
MHGEASAGALFDPSAAPAADANEVSSGHALQAAGYKGRRRGASAAGLPATAASGAGGGVPPARQREVRAGRLPGEALVARLASSASSGSVHAAHGDGAPPSTGLGGAGERVVLARHQRGQRQP